MSAWMFTPNLLCDVVRQTYAQYYSHRLGCAEILTETRELHSLANFMILIAED